jgi:hypothetical protein
MKHILFMLVLITVSASAAAHDDFSYVIDKKVTSQPVLIYELNPPTVLINEHTPSDEIRTISKSKIVFEISGVLEGNLCTYNKTAIEINESDLSDYHNQQHNVKIISYRDDVDGIFANEGACLFFGKMAPFSFKLIVRPTGWNQGHDSITYNYHLKLWAQNKVLRVTLSLQNGWSWQLDSI